jgi:PleD family two-component response regulator
VTISAGVAGWRGGDDVGSLVERADRALYASKRAGRNRVTVESP